LTKIPYFKAALDGGFEEGIENSIAMPEDDPEAFEQILDYSLHWEVDGSYA
jgi:hypothetical protein